MGRERLSDVLKSICRDIELGLTTVQLTTDGGCKVEYPPD